MKTGSRKFFAAAVGLMVLATATSLAPSAECAAVDSIDAGGARTATVNYSMEGSIGGLGGVSTAGASEVNRAGFAGQLNDARRLSVAASPSAIQEEGSTAVLAVAAVMDDGTFSVVAPADVGWASPTYPLLQVSGGVAVAGPVYSNTTANVVCWYGGVTGSGSLTVLDSFPDNYGSYAGDGLPDAWQVQYFGLNNTNAAPDRDASGTGQNNRFKYIAGLNPTNPASVFTLKIVPVGAGQQRLVFSPCLTNRTYTPEFRASLSAGSFSNLTTTNIVDVGSERMVTDLGATASSRFYRVKISYP